MTTFTRSRFARFTASLLSFILIQTAPGMGAYQALAQVRTGVVTGGNNSVAAPGSIQLSLPNSNSVLPVGAGLGLMPALSAPNAVPNLNAGSVPTALNSVSVAVPSALNASKAAVAVMPAASKPVSVEAVSVKADVVPAALTPAISAASSVEKELASPASAAKPSALLGALNRLFDGSVNGGSIEGSPVLSAPSIGAPALEASKLSAPATDDAQPPVPSERPAPVKELSRTLKVTLGLGLALAGAGAAHLTLATGPALIIGMLGLAAPWLAAPLLAAPALAITIGWYALGVSAGLAASSYKTWFGFPRDTANSAKAAGAMTFRFWARFGLIFDAVIRGGSTDDAMKKELSANLLKYPVIAWLFVLAGYVMAPIAFVLGIGYRLVATPLLAAFRGLREVVVGILPWMADVLNFLKELVFKAGPFLIGLVWGGLKGLFYAAAAGAVVLAGPIARDSFQTEYKPASVPGWIAYRLSQLAGLIAVVAAGAVGAVLGLSFGPIHVVMSALADAFKRSEFSPRATKFFGRWMRSVSEDGAFPALMERGFPQSGEALGLASRWTRVLNGALIALYSALLIPFVSLATIGRAFRNAWKGVDVASADSGLSRKDETGAETKVEPRAGVVLPVVLATLGFAAGALGVGYFIIAPVVLLDFAWLGGAGLIGAAAGLALSQPQAWKGWLAGIGADGKASATQSWGGWLDAAARTGAALRGDAAPRASEWKLAYLIPGVAGATLAVVSAILGGLHGAASKPVKASWLGFMAVVSQFIPALKRLIARLGEILKNFLPFFFGMLFGTIWGVLKTAWYFGSSLFLPLESVFNREDRLRDSKPGEWQITVGIALALTLVVPALAIFAGGFVLGAVLGLPVALTHGVALAAKWGGLGDDREEYWRRWSRRSLPNELKAAAKAQQPKLTDAEGRELPVWRLYVRAASWVLTAIPSAISLLIRSAIGYVRSLKDAKLEKSAERANDSSDDVSSPAPSQDEAAPAEPKKGVVWVSALLGAIGLGAGVMAAIAFGPGWLAGLAGWKLWALGAAVYAGVPLASSGVGLALSQPVLYQRAVPMTVDHAKAGFLRSYGYWTATGKTVSMGPVYGLVGGALGLAWAVAGAVFGVLGAGSTAAYAGANQVVHEMLPFLRVAWETAAKVARRFFPFVWGLVAGLVSGVIGSAAFGAMLLGRPYFKYVVSEDFEHRGVGGFLGNLLLKLVALAAGLVFGVVGIAAGLVAALPYSLTAMFAFAFQFAEIGGPVQKYFDEWNRAVRVELRRLSQLTNKFQLPEGKATIADGWIRMANVFPATLAATIAGTIAGWVGYFRSLVMAGKAVKNGQPIQVPGIDEYSQRRWDRTWSRSKKTALSFFSWGLLGLAVGGAIALLTSWTPLGIGGWLLFGLAGLAGVALALLAASVIAMIALILWLDGALR